MSYITGIHHVSLKCNEAQYKEVYTFYHDLLGLEIYRTWDGGTLFDTGAGYIEIFKNAKEDLPQGTIRHLAFACTNVDKVVALLKEHGYDVFVEPKDIEIPSIEPICARIAFVRGPLAEEIELFDEK